MEKRPRAATGRDSDKYIVRFLPDLKARIEAAAKASGRSINAEINARLQDSLDDRETPREHILGLHLAEAHEEIKRLKLEVAERGGANRQQTIEGLAPLTQAVQEMRGQLQSQQQFIASMVERGWAQTGKGTYSKRVPIGGDLLTGPAADEVVYLVPGAMETEQPSKRVPHRRTADYVNIDPSARPARKRAPKKG